MSSHMGAQQFENQGLVRNTQNVLWVGFPVLLSLFKLDLDFDQLILYVKR